MSYLQDEENQNPITMCNFVSPILKINTLFVHLHGQVWPIARAPNRLFLDVLILKRHQGPQIILVRFNWNAPTLNM